MKKKQLAIMEKLVEETRSMRKALEGQQRWDQPLTREEAAEYLKVHPDTLYRWARQNRITYSRFGNGGRAAMRFLKKDLDVFVEQSKIVALE